MPTEENTVYENLDLMVHPMRVHFNDALLASLWVRGRVYCSRFTSKTWLWSHRWLFEVEIGLAMSVWATTHVRGQD